jgi:threonine dehydratase
LPVKMADIDVILETRNPAHVDQIIASLGEGGFPAELMEDVD